MTILLIYPSSRRMAQGTFPRNQARAQRYPGMGLAMVAALTPPGTHVTIVDDEREPIPFDSRPDLVGISILTPNAKRGYMIAREFRERGVPVVLGGMHVMACPEEAQKEADATVIGEAEDTWPRLLRDFEAGAMQATYRSSNDNDLAGLPVPRRDLFSKGGYITVNTVQATRGCPFDCEFCSITSLLGRRTRCRPVEEVLEEIRGLDGRIFVLNDDNVSQERDYFKALFEGMIPLKKIWAGNASWNIAKDEEMMNLIARSGCAGVFVGFDSIVPQEGLKKVTRAENRLTLYKEAVQEFHKRGMPVIGAFIFGFDNDDSSIFRKTLDFAIGSGIDAAQINILCPYPGTPLYERLAREGRIVETDWNEYRTGHVCFEPKHLSRDELFRGYVGVRKAFNARRRVAGRVLRTAFLSSPKVVVTGLAVNMAFRKGTVDLVKKLREADRARA